MRPKVFLTRELPPKVMERLRQETELEMNTEDRVLSKEEIIKAVKGKDALLCLLTDTIDTDVMDANPYLRIIANYAVGFNNIDVDAATQRRIPVSNTPGVLTETSADLAFTLMTTLTRRIVEADKFVRTGKWKGWGPLQYLGTDIYGATLGIVGLGRIGRAIAKRAQGFDMNIVYWNRTKLSESEEKELGLTYLSFDGLLSKADFVSLNVAYNQDTFHLISKREFELMKESAYLINTARGPVVDENALVNALKEKRIMGAGLDVFEEEPEIHPELLRMENTVLLPHIASATIATRTKMGMIAVDNLLAACNGKKIPNLINIETMN
ncbi:D-glycerate dehydrogenase [Reichenbachiella sp. MALMAid0571]|uniref:2-hydroxyacid dehydrogenase n=1 Tax=Reichenbachiella sp. MALMAid0571 TaxID=3143939 RepID=UPI0032DFF228